MAAGSGLPPFFFRDWKPRGLFFLGLESGTITFSKPWEFSPDIFPRLG
jgi:hypothetical protein